MNVVTCTVEWSRLRREWAPFENRLGTAIEDKYQMQGINTEAGRSDIISLIKFSKDS